MRVFRDKTGLAVTPELWGSIRKALEGADYFILLASPQAAQSKWVEPIDRAGTRALFAGCPHQRTLSGTLNPLDTTW